jgi:2-polyprenyl-3-methyl-5-hydroxy-6-metoxy-1,4-benzoquinol methylase
MICYICNSLLINKRIGIVRDCPTMDILECAECGLVSLDNKEINDQFYIKSKMHGDALPEIESWLKECDPDDQRRVELLKQIICNKNILDFGCGAGGFLCKARNYASNVTGIELEERIKEFYKNKIKIYQYLDEVDELFDVITAFHCIEHVADPANLLAQMSRVLTENGLIVIEVPSADDALLTLYESPAFQKFTYWSQHLYLFNRESLAKLALKAGLKVNAISYYQRYPLSNHLYWLSRSAPGGHNKWAFLNSNDLNLAYSSALASIGKTDTLIAYLSKN